MTTRPPLDAPPLPGRVLFDQRWCDLAFLHWPVEPRDVVRFMPPGIAPDVWDNGLTYVGLVPFRMRGAGIGRGVPLPYVGSFLEWNVRLYSVDAQGRHGVVFRSLDATRLPIVAVANAGGVPYRWARIHTTRRGDDVTWRMRRISRAAPTSRIELSIGELVQPSALESFLVSRWGMHSGFAGRTVWVPNSHERWPLHTADALAVDDDLVAAAGVPIAGSMLRPLWSPGVHARFSAPQVIRTRQLTARSGFARSTRSQR